GNALPARPTLVARHSPPRKSRPERASRLQEPLAYTTLGDIKIFQPVSEFSESYHLRSQERDAAAAIVRNAGLAGFVYPPGHGWVSFVAADGSFTPDARVVNQVITAPLLHYVFAEDHGWSFALFHRGQRLTAYDCHWSEEIEYDASSYS